MRPKKVQSSVSLNCLVNSSVNKGIDTFSLSLSMCLYYILLAFGHSKIYAVKLFSNPTVSIL